MGRTVAGLCIPIALALGFSLSGRFVPPPPAQPRAMAEPRPVPPPAPSRPPRPVTGATAGPLRMAAPSSIPVYAPDPPRAVMAMTPPATVDGPLPTTAVRLEPSAPTRTVLQRDRGLTARVFGHYVTGNEGYFFKPTEYSTFDLKGIEYGVGLRRGMSVDTIAGLSLRALDYRVTGGGYADDRQNDIKGWLAEVEVSTCLRLPMFRSVPFLLEGSLGIGSLTTKGSGRYRDLVWREAGHDSRLYRASARLRTSERTRHHFTLDTEVGVEATRVDSDGYTAEWGPFRDRFAIRSRSSTSLAVPFRLTLWEEYPFHWGSGIIRLLFGARYDFGGGGTAAYAYNASAGGMASPNDGTRTVDLRYDPRGCEWETGVGVDLWANRGWYCRADYTARFSGSLNQINENRFAVEVGACF